jgi:hypothetical protein
LVFNPAHQLLQKSFRVSETVLEGLYVPLNKFDCWPELCVGRARLRIRYQSFKRRDCDCWSSYYQWKELGNTDFQ